MTTSRTPANLWEERRDSAIGKARLYLTQDANGVWAFITNSSDADGTFARAADGTIGIESPGVSEARIYRSGGVVQLAVVPDETP